jgi:L-cysteine S-thiosulfotransferase
MPGSRPSPKRCLASALSHAMERQPVFARVAVGGQRTLRRDHWYPGCGAGRGGAYPYVVIGDAIPESLTGAEGNPERGRAVVLNRQLGLCLLCHSGPFPGEKFQGTLAPSLAGAGSRWSHGQLRLRIVDASRLNPETIMPSYYRIDGLTRVAPAFAGKPILSAEQIEDVIAFLATLRDDAKSSGKQ